MIVAVYFNNLFYCVHCRVYILLCRDRVLVELEAEARRRSRLRELKGNLTTEVSGLLRDGASILRAGLQVGVQGGHIIFEAHHPKIKI